jgi:hypothetical protein
VAAEAFPVKAILAATLNKSAILTNLDNTPIFPLIMIPFFTLKRLKPTMKHDFSTKKPVSMAHPPLISKTLGSRHRVRSMLQDDLGYKS